LLVLVIASRLARDGFVLMQAGVPKVDVQAVDFVDQHQNRPPDSYGLLITRLP
jgi:hypothetical protein